MNAAIAREAARRQKLVRLYVALLAIPVATVGVLLARPQWLSLPSIPADIQTTLAGLRRDVDVSNDRMTQIAARVEAVAAMAARSTAGSQKPLSTEVLLQEVFTQFDAGQTDIPEAVRGSIDTIVQQVKSGGSGDVYFVVEAQVLANAPPPERGIASARLSAIRTYLYQTHDVPLRRIQTIVVPLPQAAPGSGQVVLKVTS